MIESQIDPLVYYEHPPSFLTISEIGSKFQASDGARSSLDRMMDEFVANGLTFSDELESDPNATLLFTAESAAYFRRLEQQVPEYFGMIKNFSSGLQNRGDVAENCRASVGIAVAAHQETGLYHTLQQYVFSGIPDSTEIILFMNNPNPDDSEAPVVEMHAHKDLNKFLDDYPEAPVRAFSTEFSAPQSVGFIKGILHDVIAFRHYMSGTADPILIMNDADLVKIEEGYLQTMLDGFDIDQTVDAVNGHFDWANDSYIMYPELHVLTRYYQLLNEAQGRRKEATLPLVGATSAIRLSAYCAVGGTDEISRGCDVSLGVKLQIAREGHGTIFSPQSANNILQTSARRNDLAHEAGLAPNEKWKLGFGQNDDARNTKDRANKLNGLATDLDIVHLGTMLTRTASVYGTYEESGLSKRLHLRALQMLGVGATIEYGAFGDEPANIDVFNVDIALDALRRYKTQRNLQKSSSGLSND